MANDKKIQGFKKFSDLNSKKQLEEVPLQVQPKTDSDRPMDPNLPKESEKISKPMSRKKLIPKDQVVDLPGKEEDSKDEKTNESGDVQMIGKVAMFPKRSKPSKAYNFLENVKISKNSIWYILVERQDNELQMVKYNNKKGFDLSKFVVELKSFYLKKYSNQDKIYKLIESIEVDGKSEFSSIRNIPTIEIDGKKLITKITEDLIRLLSK